MRSTSRVKLDVEDKITLGYGKLYSDRINEFLSRPVNGSSEAKFKELLRITQQWSKSKSSVIPKIIMQTWIDDQVPKKWENSPISYRTNMPDWKYVIMTDYDNLQFTELFFPEVLDVYNGFKHPIMRADFIRYMFLYIVGGFYSDLDYENVQDLSPLLNQIDAQSYFVNSGNVLNVTNSIMASKPAAPIWLEMISHIVTTSNSDKHPWWFINKHFKVMGTTGPMGLQNVLNRTTYPYAMLPSKLITPCTLCDLEPGNVCDTTGSYLIPLPGSSWHGGDSQLINSIFCNPEKTILAILLILLLLFVMFVYLWRCASPRAAILFFVVIFVIFIIFILPRVLTD